MTELLPVFDNIKGFLQKDLVASFLAGGCAGAVSRTAVSPFERVKILLQVQGPGASNYKGIFGTIADIYREEGFVGLYRGNAINCMRIFPYQAVQFLTFEKLKFNRLQQTQSDNLTTVERMGIGLVAGTVSVFSTYPMDLIRTRLSVQTAQHLAKLSVSKVDTHIEKPPGFRELFMKVYRSEGGILGLYRGVIPTTLGLAPYVAINFTVYEQIREFYPDQNAAIQLLSGAIAGGIAQTITYPFDLLRRRFQVLTMGGNELGFHYTSVPNALYTIGKQEGFFGYYKGLTANLFKVMPAMAVSWLTFETVKDFIAK